MLDKKINQTIDDLIKKIKDINLESIKLSNKIFTVEISNNKIYIYKRIALFFTIKLKVCIEIFFN